MTPSTTISPLAPADRASVQTLLATQRRVHLHLDWRSIGAWLDNANLVCWLARDSHRPVACLAAALAPGGAAWLRLAAIEQGLPPALFDELWSHLLDALQERGAEPVGVLALDPWLEPSLRAWDFTQTNAVITLRHLKKHTPPPFPPEVHVRNVTSHNLRPVAEVDAAAFESLWRHDETDLALAQGIASTFTVAELRGRIVGYQLSTQHSGSGHLARLAVNPNVQGQGIGRSLVSTALTFFQRRGVREVTVNTQQNNHTSQNLYQRMGFEMTHHSVPVWTLGQAHS